MEVTKEVKVRIKRYCNVAGIAWGILMFCAIGFPKLKSFFQLSTPLFDKIIVVVFSVIFFYLLGLIFSFFMYRLLIFFKGNTKKV